MYRVSQNNVHVHRTCRPVYEKHQATPIPFFLSEAGLAQDIYSGMVLARDGEDTVRLANATDESAIGLAALDSNPDIDDLEGLSDVPFAAWVGGPDAFFEIDAPAFDVAGTYAVPDDGTRQVLYASADGQLTSTGTIAVAELMEVVSDTRIVVRLLPR